MKRYVLLFIASPLDDVLIAGLIGLLGWHLLSGQPENSYEVKQ